MTARHCEQEFAGDRAAVSAARRFVRGVLAEVPGAAVAAVYDAETCVSELATNAVEHTRTGCGGTFRLVVEVHPHCPAYAVIAVEDQGRDDGAGPRVRSAGADGDSESGRGLWMVSQLSAAVHEVRIEHGRRVAARINLHNPDGGGR
jgi:anti-sigma regulatory factor (Ser/Thr protein kinase)